MSEKPESDEFEESAADEIDDAEDDVDVEKVFREFEVGKKKGQKVGDPAWRRLERLREEKRTAELVSDFDDYDIGRDSKRHRHGGRSRHI